MPRLQPGRQVPGGRRGGDKHVRVYDLSNDSVKLDLIGHSLGVKGVAWSRDGKLIATVAADRSLRIWKADDGSIVAILPPKQDRGSIDAVAFGADDSAVAVCGSDPNSARLINIADGVRAACRSRGTPAPSLAWPSARTARCWPRPATTARFASGTSPTARASARCKGTPTTINSLGFSADGRLASGSVDQTVRVWDPGLVEQSRDLGSHDGAVWSAVFSPDGSQVVSAGADKLVRIWDVAAAKPVRSAGRATPPR